ncbi:MAG: hypothetical protein WDA03_06065 [Trueperaceae bacterium]
MKIARYLLLAAVLLTAAAFAQEGTGSGHTPAKPTENGAITGVISGVIDGAPFTLNSFLLEAGLPELTNTAYWEDWRGLGIGISVDVSVHAEPSVGLSAWQGAFSFSLDLSGQLELVDHGAVPEMTYFESIRSAFRMSEGYLELTDVAWVDDETVRLTGQFGGTFSSPFGEEDKQIDSRPVRSSRQSA